MTEDAKDAGLEESLRVAHRLRELDLEDFEGLGPDGIRRRLTALAEGAGPVLLRAFLDGSPQGASEDDPLDVLVERYVGRRMRTIEDLLRMRESFGRSEDASK